MTLSKPIPKALLPHAITLKTPVTKGIFNDGDFEEIIIYNVRFEQNQKVRQSKSGENRTKGARIYFDCVNSTADLAYGSREIQFKTNQLVEFYGETYKIQEVKAVMAGDKIHHYRLEVI